MPGYCKECKLKQELRTSNLEAFLSLNFHGSGPKIAIECSITKHNLCYIKFYDDGDLANEQLPDNI